MNFFFESANFKVFVEKFINPLDFQNDKQVKYFHKSIGIDSTNKHWKSAQNINPDTLFHIPF